MNRTDQIVTNGSTNVTGTSGWIQTWEPQTYQPLTYTYPWPAPARTRLKLSEVEKLREAVRDNEEARKVLNKLAQHTEIEVDF